MRLILNVSLPLSALLCASCGQAPSRTHDAAESSPYAHPITTRDSRFRLRIGQTLRLRFDASPATGYGWSIDGPLPATLRMDGDPGSLSPGATRPGTMRAQTWTLRAERSGCAMLRFLYRREWEHSSLAADRRDVEVVVE